MRDDMRNALAERNLLTAGAAEMERSTLVDESPEGVDRTLIRAMLELSPRERLATLQAFADFIQSARGGREQA